MAIRERFAANHPLKAYLRNHFSAALLWQIFNQSHMVKVRPRYQNALQSNGEAGLLTRATDMVFRGLLHMFFWHALQFFDLLLPVMNQIFVDSEFYSLLHSCLTPV